MYAAVPKYPTAQLALQDQHGNVVYCSVDAWKWNGQCNARSVWGTSQEGHFLWKTSWPTVGLYFSLSHCWIVFFPCPMVGVYCQMHSRDKQEGHFCGWPIVPLLDCNFFLVPLLDCIFCGYASVESIQLLNDALSQQRWLVSPASFILLWDWCHPKLQWPSSGEKIQALDHSGCKYPVCPHARYICVFYIQVGDNWNRCRLWSS